jgi:hypothetical protein
MARRHQLHGLIRWSQRDEWAADFEDVLELHLAPACEAAGVEVEDLPELIGDDGFMSLWGCAFEDFIAREFGDGSNVIDEYLKRRGWKETAPNRAYMAALRTSTVGLYEVSGIVPGESFLARDLVRDGEPVRVMDRAGSRSVKPWDRIAARVVRVGERHVAAGAILHFARDLADELLGMIARVQASSTEDFAALARATGFGEEVAAAAAGAAAAGADATEVLRAAAPIFSNLWLGKALREALAPETPHLLNSEGEAIVYRSLRYGLRSGAKAREVRRALDKVPALHPESETFWNWLTENAPSPRGASAIGERALRLLTTDESGRTVLGTVELRDGAVILSVNSATRAERGRALIEPALAGFVDAPNEEIQTVEEALKRSKGRESPSPPSPFSPEQTRAIVHEALQRHYEGALDDPIPMLGGVTPRQAAETPDGRAKVAAWLKELENGIAAHPPGDPMADYDAAWLWDELGVADLRR